MEDNRQLIARFYDAFKRDDVDGMLACYSDDIVFTDPAFGTLRGAEARAMWRMLHELSKGSLRVSYDQVRADELSGSAHWNADYVFSLTGRRVNNRVIAHMEFSDGQIVRHTDSFSFYRWSRQALGPVGYLFGWTRLMQLAFQGKSRKLVHEYMDKSDA